MGREKEGGGEEEGRVGASGDDGCGDSCGLVDMMIEENEGSFVRTLLSTAVATSDPTTTADFASVAETEEVLLSSH